MPTPRVFNLLGRLIRRRDLIEALNNQRFFDEGIVQQVKPNGRVIVLDGDGRAVDAFRTTDEVFVVGQNVFLARTETGRTVIMGSVR